MNGNKYDEGKPMVGLMLKDFSRALIEVAKISTYGCKKYGSPSGWTEVQDARNRYEDALGRHLLASAISEADDESGLMHKAHLAWNALAVLELALMEKAKTDCKPPNKSYIIPADTVLRPIKTNQPSSCCSSSHQKT